jgi:hypothetical protein
MPVIRVAGKRPRTQSRAREKRSNLAPACAADGRIAARSLGDPIEIARDLAFLSPRRAIERPRPPGSENQTAAVQCEKQNVYRP